VLVEATNHSTDELEQSERGLNHDPEWLVKDAKTDQIR
jgi:hypothetical protein